MSVMSSLVSGFWLSLPCVEHRNSSHTNAIDNAADDVTTASWGGYHRVASQSNPGKYYFYNKETGHSTWREGPVRSQVSTVPEAVGRALLQEWRIVYGTTPEHDRERGGLVLPDGSVRPGLCAPCSSADQLSSLSAVSHCRVGSAHEVNAGWCLEEADREICDGNQASHFHVHADLALGGDQPSVPSQGLTPTL